jgi:hypothetical protein
VIDVYPKSAEGYICAVCGRLKYAKHGFLITRTTYHDSPGTKFSDQFIGDHEHVWVEESRGSWGGRHARQAADSFAHFEIPIVKYAIQRALDMLEGTEYLEPAVKALCDVDNYYAYLARDVLSYYSRDVFHPDHLPTREQLDKWWEQHKQFFVIEHDAQRALPLLKTIEKEEEPYGLLQEAARQTLEYHDRYGVPTLGAVVSHRAQEKQGD